MQQIRKQSTGPGLKLIRRRLLMCGFVLGALLTRIESAPALENLPDLGDQSATVLSSLEEEKLGREFMRQARERLDFIDDPELLDYINKLGKRLVKSSEQPSGSYTFYLVKDSNLNAFAVPGGHITVHTGLIAATRSEAELAAVIAHEIAHISQHHLARLIERSKRQTLPTLAAVIAGVLLGGQAGTAAIVASQAGIIEQQLKYTRGFETEADAIGIRTLARAGYDPRAMTAFFEELQRWSRIYESGAPEYLRTHPLTYNRIAESASRAEQYPEQPATGDDFLFHIVRAKIAAKYAGSPPDALAAFVERINTGKYANQSAERYGYALALAVNRKYPEARREIDALLAKYPGQLSLHLARAEIEVAAERYDHALRYYQQAREIFPDSTVMDIYYADTLITAKRYTDAKSILKRMLLKNNNPLLHGMLARAEGESGNPLTAHQELAEYHHLQGNLREALRQLDLAKNYIGDNAYARAAVDAKVNEIEQEILAAGGKIQRP